MGRRSPHLFKFKSFDITQANTPLRVNTDGVLLGAWVDCKTNQRVLDIGTGSGVIAAIIASRCKNVRITAIDIHEGACTDARINARQFSGRMEVYHSRLQDYESSKLFDHIVTNPPYFNDSSKGINEDLTNAKHSDTLQYEELLSHSLRLLCNDGRLSLILPIEESKLFTQLALSEGLSLVRSTSVYINETTLGRRLMTWSRIKSELKEEQPILIRKSDGSYDETYKELTKDLYLNF